MRKTILFFSLMLLTQMIFAQLSWTKEIHDFGQTQLNVPLAYEFSYLNYTNKNQKIAFVKLSTNDAKPNWDNIVIKANQTGSFLLNYRPSKAGAFEEVIEIHLEDNPYPQVLTITGFVGDKGNVGYFKPNISGATPIKKQLGAPTTTEINKPEKPIKKQLKVTKKTKYEDNNIVESSSQVTTKPNKPTKNAAVKVIRKPNTKPQKPRKLQTVSSNSPNESLLKTTIFPTYVGSEVHNTAGNEAYFTEREKAMIQEVNLLRSNPKGYLKVVEAHIAAMEADKSSGDYYKDEIKVGKELVEELKQTPNLSILYPSQNIYKVAVAHGKEGKALGDLNHQGKDGRWPWDRITAADKNMQDGNENIVGGMADIRKSVLTLLIDAGIPGHLHRKTLLEPKWTHIACYDVGDIGGMPNIWLQKFGQAKPSVSPNTPSTGFINNKVKPTIMQKPGKPKVNSAETIVSISKPQKTQQNHKPRKPGKPVENYNSNDIFDNYTASTIPVNTPVNVETNELSINNLGKNIFPDADCRTAENAAYMSDREQEMIAEVNLLRTQPQRYVEIIEDYVSFIEAQIRADSDAEIFYKKELKSAEELVELLERLQPLKPTKPSRNLYKGARIYGEAAKTTGNLERQGSDGSLPWNRIAKYAPTMIDGEETLPYGSTNIRYSIIKLLIDKDDKLRTQRKVLLNPKWNFLAVYEVGKIGNVHYWIQDFGNGSPIAMHDVETENSKDEILGFATETNLLPDIQAPSDNINYKVDYLSEKEKLLLKEINLLRTNPIFYADIVNEYIQTLKSEKAKNTVKSAYYQEQIEAAKFIYQELMKIKPLSAVVPNQMLHNAAYNHGKDCQKNGRLQHWGSDGSNTWERLQGAAPGIIDGDQILVGDVTDLREIVILILVNQVLYNRSRALVILQPQWTNIAAADVGMVGKRKDCWIVTLGQL